MVKNADAERLSKVAWEIREHAHVLGPTKVGCAVLAKDGSTFGGCNVEHKFRSHDVHAEVNAITTMVASGIKTVLAVLIAAERDNFTPCGACMDWIMQFGGADCAVGFQASRNGMIEWYSAGALMPFYPR